MQVRPAKRDAALVQTYAQEWLHNDEVFPALVRYNAAHVLMLSAQGVIPPAAARLLLRELEKMARAGYASICYELEMDGLQPNLEAELVRRIGPAAAGWLNTGRARQECEFVARQIAVRDLLIALIGRSIEVRAALEALAGRHARDVMPYYTWAQQAEPITFGYYLAAVAEALAEDGRRLQAAYNTINHSRASCGQVAPPPLPIDRNRIAHMLGFNGIMTNSLYAYSSLDAELEVLAALSLLTANLARFAENLYVWCSTEFGFMQFSEALSGTSYAMPQKRNPYALRQVRPVAARTAAAWNEAMALFAGGLPMVGNGLIHVPNRLLECLSQVDDILTLLGRALPAVEVDTGRMRAACADHWVQATQLVFLLVRAHAIPFREAHHVVREVVETATRRGLKPAEVDARMVEELLLKGTAKHIRVGAKALAQALQPELAVETRTTGGPALRSVRQQLELLGARRRKDAAWQKAEARRLERAQATLKAAVVKRRRP